MCHLRYEEKCIFYHIIDKFATILFKRVEKGADHL